MTDVRKILLLLLPLVGLSIANPANARDYLIEIVLIENVQGKESGTGDLYLPKIPAAISLNGDKAAELGFAMVETGLTLTESAEKISKTRRYRILRHFAWRQPGLDNKAAKAIRVNVGKSMTVYLPEDLKPFESFIPAAAEALPDYPREITTTTVNGTLKVRLGRFLHLDSNLVFTDVDTASSFRLSESRKMRSRELHYIDNERFGILTRILPIEDEEQPDSNTGTINPG
ncbi:MAG: CsiV family protein [Granulosicoccus sp.]